MRSNTSVVNALGFEQPYWLEADEDMDPHSEVLNSVVTPSGEPGLMEIDVLVRSGDGYDVFINPGQHICSLRVVEADCVQASCAFRFAAVERESEDPQESQNHSFTHASFGPVVNFRELHAHRVNPVFRREVRNL